MTGSGGETACFQALPSIPHMYRVPTTPNPVGTGTHSQIPDPQVSRKKSTETGGPPVRLMRATARGGPRPGMLRERPPRTASVSEASGLEEAHCRGGQDASLTAQAGVGTLMDEAMNGCSLPLSRCVSMLAMVLV